jgi:hypothetical protein
MSRVSAAVKTATLMGANRADRQILTFTFGAIRFCILEIAPTTTASASP